MYDEEMNLIAKNFTMSAKDMAQMKNIPKLIDAGVKSFKIEGRMKSEYYLATVVNAYKNQIEFYNTNNKLSAEFENDLYKAANRMVSTA
jgi:putative protease